MKQLDQYTIQLIRNELSLIPEKYQKDFNSAHEGYAVILEEVRELEQEVFFGEKALKERFNFPSDKIEYHHKARMREECIQIAAMCVRFIQEIK